MDSYLKQDIQSFELNFTLSDEISAASFLITGATGLVGSMLIKCLLALNKSIRIVATVRDINKATPIFSKDELNQISFIECDIAKFDNSHNLDIDYIIHCASPTDSSYFTSNPVETFNTIVNGSTLLLEYARQHKVKGFVFLSSLEVYGEIVNDTTFVSEEFQGYIDNIAVRSSYPVAKKAVEHLCSLYFHQHNVPVKIIRLTQTTGVNLSDTDNRVIAQFCRLAALDKDIILHTNGESSRPYCYITDAISAILYVLVRGCNNQIYNVANEDTYISAKDLAEFIKNNFNNNINIHIQHQSVNAYAPVSRLRLSAQKLLDLGWRPQYSLFNIIQRIINYLKHTNTNE